MVTPRNHLSHRVGRNNFRQGRRSHLSLEEPWRYRCKRPAVQSSCGEPGQEREVTLHSRWRRRLRGETWGKAIAILGTTCFVWGASTRRSATEGRQHCAELHRGQFSLGRPLRQRSCSRTSERKVPSVAERAAQPRSIKPSTEHEMRASLRTLFAFQRHVQVRDRPRCPRRLGGRPL